MLNTDSNGTLDSSAAAARFLQAAEKRSAEKRAEVGRRLLQEAGASPLKAYVALAAVPILARALDVCV